MFSILVKNGPNGSHLPWVNGFLLEPFMTCTDISSQLCTVILVIEAMHILPFEILDLSPVTHLLREMCYIIGFSLSTAETFANVSSNFIGGNLMEKIGKIITLST